MVSHKGVKSLTVNDLESAHSAHFSDRRGVRILWEVR
jgi:hypothetical protein